MKNLIPFNAWFAYNICDIWYYSYRLNQKFNSLRPVYKIKSWLSVTASVWYERLYIMGYRLMIKKGYDRVTARLIADRRWELDFYKEFGFTWESCLEQEANAKKK